MFYIFRSILITIVHLRKISEISSKSVILNPPKYFVHPVFFYVIPYNSVLWKIDITQVNPLEVNN